MERMATAGILAGAVFCVFPAVCQDKGGTVPVYRVTVVERSINAVNYQYRSGPTRVDFRGTVLLPKAKGDATSNRGAAAMVIAANRASRSAVALRA
jgi:hypothetical protein